MTERQQPELSVLTIGSPAFGRQVSELRAKMLRRSDELLTSTLALGEILVKPMKEGNTKLVKDYQAAISGTATLLPFDAAAAAAYATLRCDPGLRAPDAIQLACAASFGVDCSSLTTSAHMGEWLTGCSSSRHSIAFLSSEIQTAGIP